MPYHDNRPFLQQLASQTDTVNQLKEDYSLLSLGVGFMLLAGVVLIWHLHQQQQGVMLVKTEKGQGRD